MNRTLYQVIERILPIIAGSLIILEIVCMNQSVGSGKEIRGIDIAIDTYHMANQFLEQQVASASALMTVEAKAKEIGFIEPKKNQVMTVTLDQQPVALNNPQ